MPQVVAPLRPGLMRSEEGSVSTRHLVETVMGLDWRVSALSPDGGIDSPADL